MRQATAKRTADKPEIHDRLAGVLRSPGVPLDRRTRAYFEPRFGHDFSRVRVHSDENAARSAEAIHARAWTVGNDVAFGRGMYEPTAPRGAGLLAHELTHVVQQRGAAQSAAALDLGPTDDRHEREADAQAASPTPLASPRVQRSALSTFLDVVLVIPRLFGLEVFPAEDLKEYLEGLKKRKGPQNSTFSDNMARACVSREKEFGPYDVDTKVWLIQEMLEGHVSFLDENAVIDLLRRSSDRTQVVSKFGRPTLWSKFDGQKRRIIEAITMTAADAGESLVSRLRDLDADEIQDYAGNAVDPAVAASVQRAAVLSPLTAPVPLNAAVTSKGEAYFRINGVRVIALPDRIVPSAGKLIITRTEFSAIPPKEIPITPQNANVPVGAGAIPELSISLKIWTEYSEESQKKRRPGFGLGTRPGDTPTIRTHERGHGQAWFDFLEHTNPPKFTGTETMLPAAFNAAVRDYKAAIKKYAADAKKYSHKMTDCVAGGTLPTDEMLSGTDFTAAICHEDKP